MKKILSLACGVSALLFASCANDEPIAPENNVESQNGDFYASLTLRLPSGSGTRAVNGGYSGTEIGQDSENDVQNVIVVLATKDAQGRYKIMSQAQASKTNITSSTGSNVNYNFNFSTDQMSDNLLDESSELAEKEVYVFVYANPTTNVTTLIDGSTSTVLDNKLGQLGVKGQLGDSGSKDHEMWQPNNFLMTNSALTTVTLPSRYDLVHDHNTAAKAFNLGTVEISRVCARFDFAVTNDNLYPVMNIDGSNKLGDIELTDMAMFNIQKQFYLLPHISTNKWSWGATTESGTLNYTICGDMESFVMSYNPGNFKGQATLNTTGNNPYNGYFYCNIINNDLSMDGYTGGNYLDWVSIRPDDWNNRTHDKNEGGTEADNNGSWQPDNSDYRIWRYTTENTIPQKINGSSVTSQRQGITTGVVFRAVFHPEDKEQWNGNVIYVHNNVVYGDLAALKKFVDENPNSVVAQDFKTSSVFASIKTDENVQANLKVNLFRERSFESENRNNFIAYAPNKAGEYVMYYFYYNRHKTNGDNTVMDEDEFGVVRNNVYKLRVTAINRLGLPKAPTDENKEDEQEEAYFKVDCHVLPWTVRVNNIEF